MNTVGILTQEQLLSAILIALENTSSGVVVIPKSEFLFFDLIIKGSKVRIKEIMDALIFSGKVSNIKPVTTLVHDGHEVIEWYSCTMDTKHNWTAKHTLEEILNKKN